MTRNLVECGCDGVAWICATRRWEYDDTKPILDELRKRKINVYLMNKIIEYMFSASNGFSWRHLLYHSGGVMFVRESTLTSWNIYSNTRFYEPLTLTWIANESSCAIFCVGKLKTWKHELHSPECSCCCCCCCCYNYNRHYKLHDTSAIAFEGVICYRPTKVFDHINSFLLISNRLLQLLLLLLTSLLLLQCENGNQNNSKKQ